MSTEPGMDVVPIVAPHDQPAVRPAESQLAVSRMANGRMMYHHDMLKEIRTARGGQRVHSDGFLSLSQITEPAYECGTCGFNSFFAAEDAKCHRCGLNIVKH